MSCDADKDARQTADWLLELIDRRVQKQMASAPKTSGVSRMSVVALLLCVIGIGILAWVLCEHHRRLNEVENRPTELKLQLPFPAPAGHQGRPKPFALWNEA